MQEEKALAGKVILEDLIVRLGDVQTAPNACLAAAALCVLHGDEGSSLAERLMPLLQAQLEPSRCADHHAC